MKLYTWFKRMPVDLIWSVAAMMRAGKHDAGDQEIADWLETGLAIRRGLDTEPTGACFLYLMARRGLVKIGIAEDPVDRMNTLVHQCGEQIALVHTVEYASREAARLAEARAHQRFKPHRTFGEWFTDVPEIRAYVARLLPTVESNAFARVADLKGCPKCGHTGPVGADFGFREMGDGTIRSQSHCRRCRATPRPMGAQVPA